MSEPSIQATQKLVDEWVEQSGGYWQPLVILARLIEEVGETARLLNHMYGQKPKKDDEQLQDLGEEIADILYTIICLANSEGIDIQDSFDKKMRKLKTRDVNRFK